MVQKKDDIHVERDGLGEQGDHLSISGCGNKQAKTNKQQNKRVQSIEKMDEF